jgi:hypothetical protein
MAGLVAPGAGEWNGQFALTDVVVVAGSLITNGHTITLVDGVGNAVTFEFRSSGSPSPGNVAVAFTGGDSADTIANAFANAIQGDGRLQLLVTSPADTVSLAADYKSSRGNFPLAVGGVTGGLVAAQAASADPFTVNDLTLVFGYEGPLAMPARLGFQRMIPTRTIPITGSGEPGGE